MTDLMRGEGRSYRRDLGEDRPRPAAVGSRSSGQGSGFVVVVAEDHPAVEIQRKTLSKIFLRKVRRWPADLPVTPVDQDRCSAVRESFSRSIHGRTASAVVKYWQRMIFSHSVPPLELASDQEVLSFVREHRGSIGYVAAQADLGAGLRALALTE